jgi:hypothetical protein
MRGTKLSATTMPLFALLLATSCEQTYRTGKVGNLYNPPSSDGTCPAGQSVCSKDNFAQCLDLQNDHDHCGTCDKACLPGIACSAGSCQQVACTAEVTASTQSLDPSLQAASSSVSTYLGGILADVNGDGHPDLITWGDCGADTSFRVGLGKVGGGFGPPTGYRGPQNPTRIVAADSNLDGFDDLYLFGEYDSPPCLEIWLGHGDGRMTLEEDVTVDRCAEAEMVADLNGDRIPDLVTYDLNGSALYFADADGKFHASASPSSVDPAITVMVLDWNGDGFPDLVSTVGGPLSISLNDGRGNFATRMDCGTRTSYAEAVADFNHDGYFDLAEGVENGVGVLLGMGGCQFQPMLNFPVGEEIEQLVKGDVDGDGNEDLVARTVSGEIVLLRGQGDGTFQVSSLSASTHSQVVEDGSLLIGDVTGDGRADVLVLLGHDSGSTAAVSRIVENTCP